MSKLENQSTQGGRDLCGRVGNGAEIARKVKSRSPEARMEAGAEFLQDLSEGRWVDCGSGSHL